MPEQYENNQKDFSVFDSMSSEMLENILRADAQQLDDDTNLDAVLYITELLEERARSNNCSVDVDRMYQQFVSGCGQMDYSEHNHVKSGEIKDDTKEKQPKRKRGKTVLRLAVAVAAAICLLIASTGVAAAFGFNIWGIIATWTESVFFFERSSNISENDEPSEQVVENNQEYGTLQDALDHLKIGCVTETSVLTEQYAINVVDVYDEKTGVTVYADYYSKDDGGDFLSVCVRSHNGSPSTSYEKTKENVETFPVGNVLCYAFDNTNNKTIVWLTEEYECSVAGTASMEEIKMIVESLIED